jgi:hypothetical protein
MYVYAHLIGDLGIRAVITEKFTNFLAVKILRWNADFHTGCPQRRHPELYNERQAHACIKYIRTPYA